MDWSVAKSFIKTASELTAVMSIYISDTQCILVQDLCFCGALKPVALVLLCFMHFRNISVAKKQDYMLFID